MKFPPVFLLFLLSPTIYAAFNTASAKNWMIFIMCASADNPTICVKMHFPNYEILSIVTLPCTDLIWGSRCTVTISRSDNDKTIMVTFAGSKDMGTFLSTGRTKLAAMPLSQFESYGNVGSDYASIFPRLWNSDIVDSLIEMAAYYCDYKLVVAGHSVGGCLGQMLLLKFKDQFASTEYYGYGTPRCGDQTFANNVNQLSADMYRVIWPDDGFVEQPATTCDRSTNAILNSGTNCYFHCCTAQLVKLGLFGLSITYTACPISESTTCTKGAATAPHVVYYSTRQAQYESLTCNEIIKTFF